MDSLPFDKAYLNGKIYLHGGSIYYADGSFRYTSHIEKEGANYLIRVGNGEYREYDAFGKSLQGARDIIRFVPRPYEEHEAEHGKPWEYRH